MVQTRSFRFFLSAGMILGIASLLGCASQMQTRAPEPPGTAQGQVVDLPALLAAADQAFQKGAYEDARKLYAMARQDAEGLSPEQADLVRTRLASIEKTLKERAPAAEAAPKMAAPAPKAPSTAAGQAPALLAEVEALVKDKKYAEAVPKLAVLDPLRRGLPMDLKLRYDQARFAVAGATRDLPALSEDQRADRAQEDFDAGVAAYDKDQLLVARGYLEAARQFDIGIGFWDNRKLRSTLAAIDERLSALRKGFEAGKAAYLAGQPERAVEQLSKVVDSGVSLGEQTDKDARTMLADAREKAAAKAEAQKMAAAQAAPKVAAAPKEQPAPPKAPAAPAAAKEQPAPPKAAAAPAAPKAPTAEETAAKKEADAQAAYDAGMKAYDAKDYLLAKEKLTAARDSGVGFGFFGNRRLRSRLSDVSETLNRLQTAYKTGKSAYEAGDFENAQRYLSSVAAGGVSLGKETDADVQKMLAGLDQKVAQQRAAKAREADANARAASEAEAQRARDMEEQAKKLAAEAEALLQAQNAILARLAAADEALARKDMESARKALTEAQEALKQPKVAELHGLAGAGEKIRTKLAAIDEAMAAQKRMDTASAQLATMVQEAQDLSKTDLLGAEQKAQEAARFAEAQGVPLSGQQAMALAGVTQAVNQKYGVQRRVRRDEYGKLPQTAKSYADAGQFAKAAQLYSLLAAGDQTLVQPAVKDKAAADAAAAQRTADQQKQKAAELVAAFDKARQALKSGGLDAGLKARQDIVNQAKTAGLSTADALSALNTADMAFLDKDVRQAIADASKALAGSSDKLLARARQEIEAAQTSQPAAGPAPDLKDQTARLYDLAQQLHQMVVEGNMAKVDSVKQQMADVQLGIDVQKALYALKQGKADEAAKALDDAKPADASESVRKNTYAPARAQVDAALAAEQQLIAVQEALTAHDFAKAAQAIQQVQGGAQLPAVLQAKLAALAGVLNAVRDGQARLDTQTAFVDQAVAALRQRQAQDEQRRTAWDGYVAALKALFTGSTEDAAKALAGAAAMPGLSASEAQNVQELAAGLSAGEGASQAEAARMLATAQGLYDAGDYAGAAQALSNVKASQAYAASADLREGAAALEKKIQAKEQQAESLYTRAVSAYNAGNAEEVGRLMAELKSNYSKTRAFQQHQ